MWLATRARITGNSHVRNGLPCQDFAESQVVGDCMVSIVADGASNAPLGEIGASIAVETIKEYFGNISPESLFAKSEQVICTEIKRYFDSHLKTKIHKLSFPTRQLDYAATVAFIAVFEKYNTFYYGVIGDCAVAIITDYGEIYTISPSDNNQRPHFISDDFFTIQFGYGKLSNHYGFVLATDGCVKGGLMSLKNHFDVEVITEIFENLPFTQNPEMWLASFINTNIAQFTPDDLSMYIIYPDTNFLLGNKTVKNLFISISCHPRISNFCISVGDLSSEIQRKNETEEKSKNASKQTKLKKKHNTDSFFKDGDIRLILLAIIGLVVLEIIFLVCLGEFNGFL